MGGGHWTLLDTEEAGLSYGVGVVIKYGFHKWLLGAFESREER